MTPTGRHALTYDEESWKPKPDDRNPSKSKESSPDEIGRSSETRQSKTKRVKNYLKKCKNALGSRSNSNDQSSSSDNQSTSWFVDKKLEEALNESEIHDLEDVFEKVHINPNLKCDFSDKCRVASVVDVKSRSGVICEDVVQDNSSTGCDLDDQKSVAPDELHSSPLLSRAQEQVDVDKDNDKEATEKETTEVSFNPFYYHYVNNHSLSWR